ncbi:RILP-like protein homolog [Trichonephila clavata]|uniref:RILP-like protein homolog n=1 Tax=Trichonephila clavata TaxID=2740835 RepID=A0A8X6GH74_TRICU|nr:RILP-like protein homolog [Trichonephila clavata]
MDKHVDSQIFVGDVYDLAAEIGKEFEKLIDICGTDTIRELMTKVIVTLEYLESSTVIVDRLQSELYDIKAKVEQLEYEKLERAEFRSKLDQELEIIEENWRKETSHLNSLVVKLQEENKRLSAIISEKDKHTPSDCKAFLSDEELVVVQKLKELTEQHRGQLIQKDKELLEKTNELDKMQLEVDRLLKVNKEFSHRNRHLQKQMYTLVEEKSDLQANMQNQQKECFDLQARLDAAVKENMDLSSFEDQKKMDLHGKLIISLDDPNRPRFTLDELRHILFERNDLKAKISDLEDELSLHKPKRIPSSTSLATLSVGSEEEDLPVQGPINKEPDDKLYPEKRKLGIRRFFHFLRRISVDSPVPLVPFSASQR